MSKRTKLIIAFIIVFLIGFRLGIMMRSQPTSKYDCLKLNSDVAKVACVRWYFPND